MEKALRRRKANSLASLNHAAGYSLQTCAKHFDKVCRCINRQRNNKRGGCVVSNVNLPWNPVEHEIHEQQQGNISKQFDERANNGFAPARSRNVNHRKRKSQNAPDGNRRSSELEAKQQ